ncbi:hypothetical protein ACFLZI_03435, partial [Nitrospirota bacterium]
MSIYSNTLDSQFVWDEDHYITSNPAVTDMRYFTNPSWAKGTWFQQSLINRYVGYFSFALNYRL